MVGKNSSRYSFYFLYFLKVILGAGFCFVGLASIWVFNLSKSEIAAWVQAVGSIGAICGALWIFRSESRQKHRGEIERQKNMGEIVRTVAKQSTHRISASLKCMKSGMRNKDVENALVKDLVLARRNLEIAIGFDHIDSRYFSVLIRIILEVEYAKTTIENWDSMLTESGVEPIANLENCLKESNKILLEI
ncbi:hypothetical protein [Pseudomonas juntendi]|uniref:hypothetical protein n=1 Tax=Pseudomonas juntendi TaxID=2666183 RepID=UPI001F45BF7C|nr:hypothetical protein [Pseudomonas juntendi]MCO7055069.1 hypothetical protein [Pseudomonas juntendi]UJM10743.1 hypothetical protein L1P09_15495 [Pseudomonas juntendi]UXA40650.1 hypothetical protein KZA81_09920 [Pseudomonas juntendi]